MTNVELFIEEYKKLEEAVRRVYELKPGESIVSELKRQARFSNYKQTIQSCADLRNFYQHDSKLNNQFIVDVSPDAIAFVKMLREQVNNRKKCRDVCVPIKKVYWRTIEDSVMEAMKVMREKTYTHVPVLEKGRVVGVFDENSLFSYIADGDLVTGGLNENTTIGDLKEHMLLKGREMEDFTFFGIDRYVDEVVQIFNRELREGKRIGLVLLTQNGRENEPLQGILTPWDLVGSL